MKYTPKRNRLIKDMVHKVIKIKDRNIVEDYMNTVMIPAADIEL